MRSVEVWESEPAPIGLRDLVGYGEREQEGAARMTNVLAMLAKRFATGGVRPFR